jgi:hypothetical protein
VSLGYWARVGRYTLVTDSGVSSAILEDLRSAGVEVVVAPDLDR